MLAMIQLTISNLSYLSESDCNLKYKYVRFLFKTLLLLRFLYYNTTIVLRVNP